MPENIDPRHRSRMGGAFALLPLIIFLMAIAWPGLQGEFWSGGDIAAYHLPMRAFTVEAYEAGQLPWWNPQVFCGFELHAAGQVGAAHPLRFIQLSLFSLPIGILIESVLIHLFAGAGGYRLMRALSMRREAVWFGAAACALLPFLSAHAQHLNMVVVAAHAPWLLATSLEIVRLSKRYNWHSAPTLRRASLLALLLASQMLFGHPPQALINILMLCAWVPLCLAICHWQLRALYPLVIAAITGACLSAVQVIPTLVLSTFSTESSTKLDFANTYSLHPLNLLQMVSPYLYTEGAVEDGRVSGCYHEYAIYIGLGTLILVARAICIRSKLNRGHRLVLHWALTIGIVALVLALGRFGYVNLLVAKLPILREFRVPARYGFVVSTGAVIAAAIAVHSMARAQHRWRTGWLILIIAILATCLGLRQWAWLPDVHLPLHSLVPLVAAIGVLAWVAHPTSRMRALMLFLVIADLACFSFSWHRRTMQPTQRAGVNAVIDNRASASQLQRLASDWNHGLLSGRLLSAGYVSRPPSVNTKFTGLDRAKIMAVDEVDLIDGRKSIPSLPRLRLAERTAPIEQANLNAAELAVDKTVYLPPEHFVPVNGKQGRIDSVIWGNTRIDVHLSGTHEQILVLADRYAPDWVCKVSEQPAVILPAYDIVRAVVVPPGDHTVVFEYQPRGRTLALRLTIVGLMLTIAMLLPRRKHRRP